MGGRPGNRRASHLCQRRARSTGLQWEPATGKLWAIANERDEIGPDLVPDYLTSVRDGGFYGWPYSYYGSISTRASNRSGRISWPKRSCQIMP